jgi:hypothetical protein
VIALRCSPSDPKIPRKENNTAKKKDENNEQITKSTNKIALIINAKKLKGYSSMLIHLIDILNMPATIVIKRAKIEAATKSQSQIDGIMLA